jgi:hypothetical protein
VASHGSRTLTREGNHDPRANTRIRSGAGEPRRAARCHRFEVLHVGRTISSLNDTIPSGSTSANGTANRPETHGEPRLPPRVSPRSNTSDGVTFLILCLSRPHRLSHMIMPGPRCRPCPAAHQPTSPHRVPHWRMSIPPVVPAPCAIAACPITGDLSPPELHAINAPSRAASVSRR